MMKAGFLFFIFVQTTYQSRWHCQLLLLLTQLPTQSYLSGQLCRRKIRMNNPLRDSAGDAEQESQVLNTIERWVARELQPIVRKYDHADRYPAEIVEQMKELGLFGATISPDYGGMGLSARPMPRSS